MKKLGMVALVCLLAIGLAAQTQHGVTLGWTQSNDATLAGDCVYSSTVSGGPYVKVSCSASPIVTYFLPLTNTNSGIKTFFVSSALDKDGIESGFSNEVSATFLVLPAPPTGLSATSQ